MKNRLTTLLIKTNQTVPGTDPFGVKGRTFLSALPLPPMLARTRRLVANDRWNDWNL